jgi:hypothetical protein
MTGRRVQRARILGALLQGAALGVLLFVAVLRLIEASAAGQVFRYQGF